MDTDLGRIELPASEDAGVMGGVGVAYRFHIGGVTPADVMASEYATGIANVAGGFTIYAGVGAWIDEMGDIISEEMVTLEAIATDGDAHILGRLADGLGVTFGQTCILETSHDVTRRMLYCHTFSLTTS